MANEMTEKRVVIGYFREGVDAHRAINALLDEGFSASQIGAAFRSASSPAAVRGTAPGALGGAAGTDTAEEAVDLQPERITDRRLSDTTTASISGPSSGSSGVTPAGLSPGSGDIFAGPGRATTQIPGAEIPSTLAHELPSELPSELAQDLPSSARASGSTAIGTGGLHEKGEADWMQKTRSLFHRKDQRAQTTPSAPVSRTSQNFGTGEGHLGVLEESDLEYSPNAFEQSFSVMGADAPSARYFSGALQRGGAVITVEAAARTSEAEAILERHNGQVRVETEAAEDRWEAAHDAARVHVFGQIQTHYRTPSGASTVRKAS